MNNQNLITALYGGAFDPVHLGHIKIASHILAQPEIAQLRLLPCHLHPDKNKIHAAPTHRYNMLKLIAKDSLIVDHCELDREGISYTVDTAKYLRKVLGVKVPLALVLGLDAYATIDHWHSAAQLPSLLHLIIITRPKVNLEHDNSNWQSVETLQEMMKHPAGTAFFMSEPLIDISSSRIRSIITQGIQPRYLLPGVIWSYIKRNRLYNYKESA